MSSPKSVTINMKGRKKRKRKVFKKSSLRPGSAKKWFFEF